MSPHPSQAPGPASSTPLATSPAQDCLVVIHTRDAALLGMRHALDQTPLRIGRGPTNHIRLDDEIVSRQHAQLELHDGVWLLIDSRSANGTLRNDVPIAVEARLSNRDRIKVGSTVFLLLTGDDIEADYRAELARLDVLDGLTSVHNERYLFEALEQAITRARERVLGLALLRFELEDIERVHDVHGSMASDFVLVEAARLVRARVRRGETFARVGEHGFAVVLPEASLDEAEALGAQIQALLEDHVFEYRCDAIEIVVCTGVARLTPTDRTAFDLFRRAAPFREPEED